MSCPIRTYPFRKPKIHRMPIPRWTLGLPGDVNHVYTTYIGVQKHSKCEEASQESIAAIHTIHEWLAASDGPAAYESFTGVSLIDTDCEDVAVWVCYWSDPEKHNASLDNLSLPSIHAKLTTPGRASIGLWRESFATQVSRLETNYSGLDYLPGLARLPGATTVEHTLSAYWGAARDRIPESAHDLFPRATHIKRPFPVLQSIGHHLVGTNYANMVHIRSGQFWQNCGQHEADAYEQKLEPTLRAGLQYLHEGTDTGAIGIRYLRNEDLPVRIHDRQRKESCGAGFFSNLEDLERWAHTHQSHLKIYRGALSHYKAFGEERRFRTWHEVSVIREGDARFEYVNCMPRTGAMESLHLEVREDRSAATQSENLETLRRD